MCDMFITHRAILNRETKTNLQDRLSILNRIVKLKLYKKTKIQYFDVLYSRFDIQCALLLFKWIEEDDTNK